MHHNRKMTVALALVMLLSAAEGIQISQSAASVKDVQNLRLGAHSKANKGQAASGSVLQKSQQATDPIARINTAADTEHGKKVVSSEMYVSIDKTGKAPLTEGRWAKATAEVFVAKQSSEYTMYLNFAWLNGAGPIGSVDTFAIGSHALVSVQELQEGSHQKVLVVRQAEGAAVRMMASNPPFLQTCCCKPSQDGRCSDKTAVLHEEDGHCCQAQSHCGWAPKMFKRGFYLKEATVRKCVPDSDKGSLAWTVHEVDSSLADLAKMFTLEKPGTQMQLTASDLTYKWAVALEGRRSMLLTSTCFRDDQCVTPCLPPRDGSCLAPEFCVYHEPTNSELTGGSCEPVKTDAVNAGSLQALMNRVNASVDHIEAQAGITGPCLVSCQTTWREVGMDMMFLDQAVADSKTHKWQTTMPKVAAMVAHLERTKYTEAIRARLLKQMDSFVVRKVLKWTGECTIPADASFATLFLDLNSGDAMKMAAARRKTQDCNLIKEFNGGDQTARAVRSQVLDVESEVELGDHNEMPSLLDQVEDRLTSVEDRVRNGDLSETVLEQELGNGGLGSSLAELGSAADVQAYSKHFLAAMREHAAALAAGTMVPHQFIAAGFAQVAMTSKAMARQQGRDGSKIVITGAMISGIIFVAFIVTFLGYACVKRKCWSEGVSWQGGGNMHP